MTEGELLSTIQKAAVERWPELALPKAGVRRLPEEIGALSGLNQLHLVENQLASIPGSIGRLRHLTVLSFAWNVLRELPAEIGLLSGLNELYLDNNQLASLPAEFGQLRNLKRLFLHQNQLRALPESFGFLRQLRWLTLDENRLAEFPSVLCQLDALEVLSIKGNPMEVLPATIAGMRGLRRLFIGGSRLRRLPIALASLENLEVLEVDAPALEFPPADVARQGIASILEFLRLQPSEPDATLRPPPKIVEFDPAVLAFRLVLARVATADLLTHFDAGKIWEGVRRLQPQCERNAAVLRQIQDDLANQQAHAAPNPLWLAWVRTTQRHRLDSLKVQLSQSHG